MLLSLHKTVIIILSCFCLKSSVGSHEVSKNTFGNSVQILLKNTGEYPYVASIELDGKQICGGVILTEDCVLTAAHCIEFMRPERLRVRVGHTYKYENSENIQIRSVNYFEVHPNFDGYDYDVAIIKTLKRFYFDKFVQAIQLPQENIVFKGVNATVLGWGKTSAERFGKYLKRVKLSIINNFECAERMKMKSISKTSVCGFDRTREQRECLADSGDPLVLHDLESASQDVLVGIVSRRSKYEDGCLAQLPVMFSKIGYLRPWILYKLGPSYAQ